jgi:hypothetical protein
MHALSWQSAVVLHASPLGLDSLVVDEEISRITMLCVALRADVQRSGLRSVEGFEQALTA